jgi:uracil-DNA glycosylase
MRRRLSSVTVPGRFDRFIDDLARVELSDRAVNQYAESAVRRRNLRLYFEELGAVGPRLLLVGEAVSYRGGRLTGIPFVSESLMLCGVDGRVLGADRGYRKADPATPVSTEASATMVWATIRAIDPLPLLWNAFPFHPFQPGNPLSNRMPSVGELAIGAPFIARLLRLFPIERVVAVGNQASRCLGSIDVEHVKVRHPSQGGKRAFVDGMARLSHHSHP